jgi:hypothetical protein
MSKVTEETKKILMILYSFDVKTPDGTFETVKSDDVLKKLFKFLPDYEPELDMNGDQEVRIKYENEHQVFFF